MNTIPKSKFEFKKPKKTHVNGETKRFFTERYKNTNKIILYLILFGLIIIENMLKIAAKVKQVIYNARR